MARAPVAFFARWVPLAVLTGVLAGCASALLIRSLTLATALREAHPWLIALLPLAGLASGLLYRRFGRGAERGNNLILDTIHEEAEVPAETVPGRMAPLILTGTLLSHVFGGSAGREGTAVQMGASLAGTLARPFRLDAADRRLLLMAGMSAGFGSVFGTPLAGAVFGIEVLTVGTLRFDGTLPCLIAAVVGDRVTRLWLGSEAGYHVAAVPAFGVRVLLAVAVIGALSGLAAGLFVRAVHAVEAVFARLFAWPPLRPVVGGAVIAALVFGFHATRYIGLGLPGVEAAFAGPRPPWEWLLKLTFTALTLGCGFKGGEVTPLFFMGATLGSALALVLPLPVSLAAAMGFTAIFSGAANTPVTSVLLAFELFGPGPGFYAIVACFCAYLCSGQHGIYASQRPGEGKLYGMHPKRRVRAMWQRRRRNA